jgi:hypothetical protein
VARLRRAGRRDPNAPSRFRPAPVRTLFRRGFGAEALCREAGENENLNSLIEGIPPADDLLDNGDSAPVIRLINGLIAEAVKRKASDIDIEPFEDGLLGQSTPVLNEYRRLSWQSRR